MDRIHRMATLTRNSAVSFDLRRSDPLCRVGCQIAIRRFRSLGETRWVYSVDGGRGTRIRGGVEELIKEMFQEAQYPGQARNF